MKLFGVPKKMQGSEKEASCSTPGTTSINSESDSLKELRPMFVSHNSGKITNDSNLNLNPAISEAESLITEEALNMDLSMFSSRISHSTRQSSYHSNISTSTRPKTKNKNAGGIQYGQPLQILEVSDEVLSRSIDGTLRFSAKAIADKLHSLWRSIHTILCEYTNSMTTLSATVINIIALLNEFIEYIKIVETDVAWDFNSYNNDNVRKILKTYLHFYDNLLQQDAYVKLRLLLCQSFNEFSATLNSSSRHEFNNMIRNMAKPCNYAIGINDGKQHKSEESIRRVMGKIARYNHGVKEQNGSFIAPIARGISKEMNVLCLYFGYRSISDYHSGIAASIQDLYDDVHVIVAKNRIEPASAVASKKVESYMSQDTANFSHKFKPPFRIPSDSMRPPMSISLSTEGSQRVSGTMGGFIYPIIDKEQLPHLMSYANSKFALSCGHVCLENKGETTEYPYIASPLAVLIDLYKRALRTEYDKFSQTGQASGLDSRMAYSSIISQLDHLFPLKRVKKSHKSYEDGNPEFRNLPRTRFGQIIWGERTLIQAKSDKVGFLLNDKRLSDLAIIKVNKAIHCDQNYLGDDVAFSEFDPSLMFDNLYVRKLINLRRYSKESPLSSVHEVDSMVSTSTRNGDGTYNMNGLPVFKYGSTTKFTRGNLNGIKLVYWMDGAIHSSEFVVNSADSSNSFAAGGDSGAWILAKLEDVRGTPETKGLGVAGMLHSYDGEFRQFGLFTPMSEILERLEEVTHIKWGVVGVPEKDNEFIDLGGSSDSEYENSSSCDSTSSSDDDASDYKSFVDEQAIPPEID